MERGRVITLCADTCCPVREHCERYQPQAVSAPHTARFLSSPRSVRGCPFFAPERVSRSIPTSALPFAALAGILLTQ